MFSATLSKVLAISSVSFPRSLRCAFTRAASHFAQERIEASYEMYLESPANASDSDKEYL